MGRPSVISYEDVVNAVETLKAKGKPINPYQIKSILQRGSESKILYFLKGMGQELEYQDEDPLTQRLVNLVKPIAVELQETFAEQLEADKRVLKKKLEESQHRKQQYQNQLGQTLRLCKETQQRLDEANTEAVGLKKALENEQSKLLSTQHELALTKQKLNEAKDQQDALKQTHSRMLEEHKQQIRQLKDERTETLHHYKISLSESNQTIQQVTDQWATENRKNQALALECNSFKHQLSDKIEALDTLNDELKALKNVEQQQRAELEKREQQADQLKISLERSNEQFNEFNETKQRNQNLEKNNQLLEQRNYELEIKLKALQSVLDQFSVAAD